MATTVATTLAICTLILYAKFLLATLIRGWLAFSAGSRPPEDAVFPIAKGKPVQHFDYEAQQDADNDADADTSKDANPNASPTTATIEAEKRWQRIVQSDVESIPLALGAFIVTLTVGGNVDWISDLVIIFTAARVLHTLSFAFKLAYARAIMWAISVVCIVASAIVAIDAIA
jgi:glutathione S-transferase